MTTIHSYTNDQVLTDVYPRGPASRAFGHDVDDPDQDRRRCRRGPRAAGAEGQARRLRDPRADHQRVAGRSDVQAEARHDHRGDQLAREGGGRRRVEGRAGVHRRPAGVGRLQPRSGFVDLRRDADQDHRRQPREGVLVVRQRVGLLEPHARHGARLVEGQAEVVRDESPRDERSSTCAASAC